MKNKEVSKKNLLVNFCRDGGIKQFSDKICQKLVSEGENFEYIETLSYRVLYKAIKQSDTVFFLLNYRKLYLFLFLFPFKEFRLVHHEQVLRVGSGIRDKLSYFLFQVFQKRFSKIIVHDEIANMPKNMKVLKMPLHGEPVINKKKIQFLQFGRIEKYKNIEQVVDVVAQIESIELTIAGGGQVSDTLLEKINTAENISLINQYIDDRLRNFLMRNSDYLVLAYQSASQTGLVDLACYFNLPQIISNITPFNLYKNYKTACFVDVFSESTLLGDINNIPQPESDEYLQMVSYCDAVNKKQDDEWDHYISQLMNIE